MVNEKPSGASGGSKPSIVKRGYGCEVAIWDKDKPSKRQNVKIRFYWKGVDNNYVDKSMGLYERELRNLVRFGQEALDELVIRRGGGGGG